MGDRNDFATGEPASPAFTADGRHVLSKRNGGNFRAPTTRGFGAILIAAGVFVAFNGEDRWKAPFFVLGGVLVLVFARYLRHLMVPDCWYIAEDDRAE